MTSKYLRYSAAAFCAFVASGLLIAFLSEKISQATAGTYVVLGVAAVSVFAWPIFLGRAFQEWFRDRRD